MSWSVCVVPALTSFVLLVTACDSSSSPDLECNCPANVFAIAVPPDRASDIKSVRASGACAEPVRLSCKEISVLEESVGTCHIAVTFKSGAPEYDTDVTLAHGTFECETVCFPTPTSPVVIPDVDGGSVVASDAGCGLGAGGEGGGF
jgi:hypothetical protein